MDYKIIIKKLQEDKIDETVDILIESFPDEAFTKAWLDLSCDKIRDAYSKASKVKFLISIEAGQPIFIAMDKEKVVGFVVLKTPGTKISVYRVLKGIIGNLPVLITLLPSFIRVLRIGASAMKPPLNMPENYCTLEAIGVDPQFQGKKVGSVLLKYAHNFCNTEKASSGIYLITGDEKNKEIYDRYGYELIEARNTKGFVAYHMFLPNETKTDRL